MIISLRNLPPEIQQAITETSRREGISLNKATVRILQASLNKTARNDEFDEFLGQWPQEEADAFDGALREMRRIETLHSDLPR